jgi:TonB family protein
MKKHVLLSVLFFSVLSGFAQSSDPQNMKVVTNSEPSFPQGDQALYTYVYMNLKYPETAVKKYIEGEVTLSFDVKPDSTVANVLVISGVGNGVDEELKKLVSGMKFIPAVQNGRKVKMNTMYSFPVKAH